jgi:membrane glycosyltransferase
VEVEHLHPPARDRRFSLARWTFFLTAAILAAGGIFLMFDLLWRTGINGARILFLILFGILFSILCVGFAHALFGFIARRRTPSSSRILETLKPGDEKRPLARTALVFPVYNENVDRVFAGVRSVFLDLQRTGEGGEVEIYILSDSTSPDNWVREEFAWVELCRQLGAFDRIFYRRRMKNVNRKSGNLADFCQAWGGRYPYMIVMDADSIMTGEAVLTLIRLMEKNPEAGIIQTAPRIANGETIFGRMQQFASRAYGPIFQAGLDFWQGSVGNYWGHNAIIRMEPFTEYCDLPDLPGKEPFGGKILSHDFVEAALMVKAGWQVWLAYDLEGTWEEGPPSIIDSAKRDRRWMQGNLQHTWLLLARGLHPGSRVHLLMGILGYLVSPLWLVFIMLSFWIIWQEKEMGLTRFPVQGFVGRWLELDQSQHGLLIFVVTLGLLFASKAFALIDMLLQRGRVRAFGGVLHVIGSIIGETLFSTLIAPMLMLFHTKFFVWLVFGQSVNWGPQRRTADGTGWGEALRAHLGHTLFAGAAGALAWWLSRPLFYWMLPITASLAMSIPVSVFTSSRKWGLRFRAAGFFAIPEETQPPRILTELAEQVEKPSALETLFAKEQQSGLTAAIVDPYVNAVHVSLLKPPADGYITPEPLAARAERLLAEGPEKLSASEALEVLSDADLMLLLHRSVWAKLAGTGTNWWRIHVERYRVSEWVRGGERPTSNAQR